MAYLFLKRAAAVFSLAALTFFLSCSPKVNKNYAYNRYIRNFNIQVFNDSLQLHLTSPADIKYLPNDKSLKAAWKSSQLKSTNEIALLGTTDSPPYTIAVTLGNAKEPAQKGSYKIIDTTYNGQQLHFIARTDSMRAVNAMEGDLANIFSSLKLGKNYLDGSSTVMDVVDASMNNNQFYKALSEVEQFPLPPNQGNSLELQMQLTFASFLAPNDTYDRLLRLQEARFKPNDTVISNIQTNAIRDAKAIERILSEAQKAQVFMMNENHYYPQHRLLVKELLPKLKSLGYSYLALEALAAPNDSLLNVAGAFPTLSTGFYTREQHFGNLLREAVKLGFKLVAYENTDNKMDRELGQATNLYNRTLAVDPKAKILVLVGIDHLLEKPTPYGKKWMATVFKEKYGIDPLTLSQTHLNLYRKYSATTYSLLGKADLSDQQKYGAVDLYVLNNQVQAVAQGPSYTNKFGKPVQVSLFVAAEQKTSIDFGGHIPYYTKLLKKNEAIKLPIDTQQSALLVVYDAQGHLLEKKSIGNP